MKYFTILLILLLPAVSTFAGEIYRAPSSERPSGVPEDIFPEKQVESHTCGLHATRSIYTSYRLPVDDFALRERLGTDAKLVPFFSSTKGTIHPDVLRVYDQDGFQFEYVDLEKTLELEKLHIHLEEGHYTLLLINRKENDALHWVVLAGLKDGHYEIVDSLHKEKQLEDLRFLSENVQTALLIKPQETKELGKGKSHRKGLWQSIQSLF